jgi:hypothetical protein
MEPIETPTLRRTVGRDRPNGIATFGLEANRSGNAWLHLSGPPTLGSAGMGQVLLHRPISLPHLLSAEMRAFPDMASENYLENPLGFTGALGKEASA